MGDYFTPSPKAQERMQKYMVQPSDFIHLNDMIQTLNADQSDYPEWQVELIASTKASMDAWTTDHFKKSAGSRQKFESMDERMWKDPETNTIVLTEKPRPVLGYLPKLAMVALEKLVFEPYSAEVKRLRDQITKNQTKMRASTVDEAEVQNVLGDSDSFLMSDIVTHREIADHWADLEGKKSPIIQQLQDREEFLQECDDFEDKATGDKARYAKGSSSSIQEENKFRGYAAKKIEGEDSEAIRACRQYFSDTGRLFEIDGVNYLEMIKEQKFGRPAGFKDSLKKLAFEKISMIQKQKFSGLKVSNLVPDSGAKDEELRVSLYENGHSTNDWVTGGKHEPDHPVCIQMAAGGYYNNSVNPNLA